MSELSGRSQPSPSVTSDACLSLRTAVQPTVQPAPVTQPALVAQPAQLVTQSVAKSLEAVTKSHPVTPLVKQHSDTPPAVKQAFTGLPRGKDVPEVSHLRQNRNYRCKRCSYTTTRPKLFLFHQKTHGDNVSVFPCDLCDYASRYKCKVLRHRKFVHSGAKDIDPLEIMEETECDVQGKARDNLDVNGNEMTTEPSTPSSSPEPVSVLGEIAAPLVEDQNTALHIREATDTQGQSTFHCKLCTFTDSQKYKVTTHIKSFHMKEKEYRCPFCTFVTTRKIEFCIHKAKHSTKPAFTCEECPYSTSSKHDYDQHIATHKQAVVKCKLCDHSAPEAEMSLHMQDSHPDFNEMAAAYSLQLDEGSRSPPISVTPPMLALAKLASQDPRPSAPSPGLQPDADVSCPVCGLVLKSDAKLRIHMVSHTQESTHRCPLCTLKYKRSSDLNRHMKKKHGIRLRDYMLGDQDEPLNLSVLRPTYYQADQDEDQPLDLSCKKKVPSQNGSEALKCTMCTYVAKWPSDLHRHMLVHSMEKRYSCTYCNRRYKYKFDLNMHLRKMHKVPAGRVKVEEEGVEIGIAQPVNGDDPDEDEDRDYMSSPSQPPSPASENMESYKPQGPITPLKPAAAEKLLKSPRQMQLGPASKFRCDYCPYYGACRSEVDRHLRLHTGEKPYSCLFCTYKSHWKGDMKRHIQKHHPDNVPSEDDISDIMKKAYQPENAFDHVDQLSNMEGIETKPIVGMLKPSPSPTRLSECSSSPPGAPPNMIVNQNGEVVPSSGKSTNGSLDGSPKRNMCPYCPFVCEAPSKLKCHMEIHENLKRFKCPHCGKRSNWTWDVRKHIKKEHPGMDLNVVVLPEEEARTSLNDYLQHQQIRMSTDFMNSKMPPTMVARRSLEFPEYLDSDDSFRYDDDSSFSQFDGEENMCMDVSDSNLGFYDAQPRNGRYRPYKCSKCGRRSNWKWDLRKHIRTSHPDSDARMIIMSEQEARASWPPEKPVNLDHEEVRRIQHHVTPRPEPPPSTQILQQVDTKRLKRFKCALCPYRSNYRSDIGRHTKRLHRKMPFKVIILDEEEAQRSLEAYKDTFGHKKFVLSPAKNKVAQRMKAAQLRHQVTNYIDSESFNHVEMPRYGSPHSDSEATVIDDVEMPEAVTDEEAGADGAAPMWKCTKCDYRDADKQSVVTHITSHPHNKMYRCKLCGDTSDYRNSIYRHVRNRHESTDYVNAVEELQNDGSSSQETGIIEPWRCTVCEHIADCKSAIIRHAGEQHPDHEMDAVIEAVVTVSHDNMDVDDGIEIPEVIPRQNLSLGPHASSAKHLVCNVCPYRTNKSGLLKIHKTYHKIQPGNRFKCKYCPYYVSAMRLLHQHVRLHLQQTGETLASGDPGTKIPDSEAIREEDHTATKNTCDQCPFICKNKNDFIYHKQFHRPKPTAPFKCPHCPYWVSKKRLLSQHERVHQPGYNVKMNGQPQSHCLASPAKSEASDYCDAVEMATLKQQIISSKITSVPITPEKFKPINEDEEDDVDSEADNDEKLTMHGFVVSSDSGKLLQSGLLRKMYKCAHCPYTNIRSNKLKLHEEMHKLREDTLEKDIIHCQYCTYKTTKKELLSQHIKVHAQQYEPGRDDLTDYEDPNGTADEDEVAEMEDQPLELTKKPAEVPKAAEAAKKPASHDGTRLDAGQLPTEFYVKYNEMSGEHVMERASVQKFSCEKCPYATLRRYNFERHVLLHGCRQRFTCEFCDYSVPAYQLLLQHKKLHLMPNPNLLSMQSISNLNKLPEMGADVAAAAEFPVNKDDAISLEGVHDHLDLYENSEEFTEPKKLYRCDRCPFTNTRRDNLLAHLKFHMIRSALQCSYCDYSVSKQHLLTQHMKVHFNEGLKSPVISTPTSQSNISSQVKDIKPTNSTAANGVKVEKQDSEKLTNDDDSQPEYIDLSELSSIKEGENNDDNNNGAESGKENEGQGEGQTIPEGDQTCQYCDRTFSSTDKLKKHEVQHLVGKKY